MTIDLTQGIQDAQNRIETRRARIKRIEADNACDLRYLQDLKRREAERAGHFPKVPK